MQALEVDLDPVEKLTRDIRAASVNLSKEEARFLVDAYTSMQKDRIRAGNQVFALNKSGEPHDVMSWLQNQSETLEKQVLRALNAYVKADPVGQWMTSITGVGPIAASGFLAYIDIHKAPTVGHIWRFCLPEGTPIATPAGYRAIDQFQVGDAILAHDGSETVVTQTFAHEYTGQMVTIRATGHLPLDITADHEVYVRQCDGSGTWIPAGDLQIGMHVAMPKHMDGLPKQVLRIGGHPRAIGRQPLLNQDIEVDADLAWFFGLFLADGSTTIYREGKNERGSSNITFSLDDDAAILQRAETIAQRFGGTHWITKDESKQLYFGRTSVTRAFRAWFGSHASEKRVPSFVLAWDNIECLRAFAEGFACGDGCEGYWGQHMSSASQELILGMQRLIAKCGVMARAGHTVRKEATIEIRGHQANQLADRYRLNLRPADCKFEQGDDPLYTNRRPIEDATFYWDTIIKLEMRDVTEMAVYNVKTAANTYIAKNTAVHNCGLDPTVSWNKGCKRPWCAALKRLCWLLGESFVKVSGRESDTYGKVYKARKELEVSRNTAGLFKEQAEHALLTKKYDPTTEAYKAYIEGRLPDARIHMRAKRYAVKLFLSALHEVMYFTTFHEMPPKPYVISHLQHAHYYGVPNADLIPGLVEAQHGLRVPLIEPK